MVSGWFGDDKMDPNLVLTIWTVAMSFKPIATFGKPGDWGFTKFEIEHPNSEIKLFTSQRFHRISNRCLYRLITNGNERDQQR
jgi:hypothetical protein